MQSSSEQPLVGGALRDDPNNGCGGDYFWLGPEQKMLEFSQVLKPIK